MSRSARRPGPGPLAGTIAALTLAACTAVPRGPSVPFPSPSPPVPAATPVQPYGPYPTLPVTGGSPPIGNTDRHFPELSVALEDGYAIELVDPDARAWWIVVSGTGAADGDRLEIVAEAGDVWPGAVVRLYVAGALVDTFDLNGLVGSDTAVAGGCHPALDLCFSSADMMVDPESGRLSVRIEGAGGRVAIRGATASWDGEPFVLGPWRGTETVTPG